MKYEHLKSVSYQSTEEYEKLYNSRFNSDEAVHIDLLINGSSAFFLRTPDLYEQIIRINKLDRKDRILCEKLPSRAKSWFKKKCLIDEIVSTNVIEGVISTRKRNQRDFVRLSSSSHRNLKGNQNVEAIPFISIIQNQCNLRRNNLAEIFFSVLAQQYAEHHRRAVINLAVPNK